MQTLSEIKAILAERGLRPRRRFGQNFLHDKNQLTKLIEAANVQPGEVVLEVGPGTGTLTEALVQRGAEVVACEIDRDLAAIVRERMGKSVTLLECDAMEHGRKLNGGIIAAIGERPFKLIANLPYQIASPLMAALLIDHSPLSRDVQRSVLTGCTGHFVTIQKEVADRLLASSGTKEYGPLTVIVRAFADVKKIATLAPSCFWPAPQVTSAMVAITPCMDRFPADASDRASFARFVTKLFSQRRKQLGTIFGRDQVAELLPEEVSPKQRPEALRIEQLIAIWQKASA